MRSSCIGDSKRVARASSRPPTFFPRRLARPQDVAPQRLPPTRLPAKNSSATPARRDTIRHLRHCERVHMPVQIRTRCPPVADFATPGPAGPLLVPGVFSPLVAKLAERLGFQAVYLSGGALSAGNGVPDIGLLTLTEFVAEAQRIAASHDPAAALRRRHRVRRSAERRAHGAAVRSGRGGRAFTSKTRRCRSGAGTCPASRWSTPTRWRRRSGPPSPRERDPDFVIIARTDARGVTGFDDAVRRAKLYLDAGADAIFPEAMEIGRRVRRVRRRPCRPRCWRT